MPFHVRTSYACSLEHGSQTWLFHCDPQIKGLIQKYIQSQQTINLVVVPCNVDIATTEALSMAHMVDPEGDRTIGERGWALEEWGAGVVDPKL